MGPSEQLSDLPKEIQEAAWGKSGTELLRLLNEKRRAGNGAEPQSIAERLFPGSDPRSLNRLRTVVYRVRARLNEANNRLSDGSRISIRFSDGKYWLDVGVPGESASPPDAFLHAFWHPYFLPGAINQIQTSDRFFLRFGDHLYLRYATSEDGFDIHHLIAELADRAGLPPESQLRRLSETDCARVASRTLAALASKFAEELGGLESDETKRTEVSDAIRSALLTGFRPRISRHYVTAGESVAVSHCAEMLSAQKRDFRIGNRRGLTTEDSEANIIQVGRPRGRTKIQEIFSNQLLQCIQNSLAATRSYYSIDGQRVPSGPCLFDETEASKDVLGRETKAFAELFGPQPIPLKKHVLVTRCRNDHQGRWITQVTSSHGRATEAVTELLTSDAKLNSAVFAQLGWSAADVPDEFQLVFEVKITRRGDRERTSGQVIKLVREYCPGQPGADQD